MFGKCNRCLANAVKRDGNAIDGRPFYRCQACGDWYTKGFNGEEWDELETSDQ